MKKNERGKVREYNKKAGESERGKVREYNKKVGGKSEREKVMRKGEK